MTAPVRILVLDDEPRIRELIAQFLEDFDEYEVVTAHSGEEALKAIEEGSVSVCIVDIRLPGMSGAEFIRLTREKTPSSRFIIHTGSVEIWELAEQLGLGLTSEDVFLKPADLDALLERIRQLTN